MNDLLKEVKRKKVPTKVDYVMAAAMGAVMAVIWFVALTWGYN